MYHDLWTPGTNPDGYKADELDNLDLPQSQQNGSWKPHGRLAVHNLVSEYEPLLHFLGLPFDEKYNEDGQQTQLEAMAALTEAYEKTHEGLEMIPLNAKAVAMIALTRRIKGQSMPLQWGFMRDGTLPRKTVDGGSCVGDVYSIVGRLDLGRSYGYAVPFGGVGVSVGLENLKS